MTTYEISVPIEGSVTWEIQASSLKEALEKARDARDYTYEERLVHWVYNDVQLYAKLASGDGVEADGQHIAWREVRDAWEDLMEGEG